MSRLHRARHRLKEIMEKLPDESDYEETTMTIDERFKLEIEAEIDVLLKLFTELGKSIWQVEHFIMEHYLA